MNIWLEGLYLEEIRNKKNKSEDVSPLKLGEELQDTTAENRSEETHDSTVEGTTQTDLVGKQHKNGRVSGNR